MGDEKDRGPLFTFSGLVIILAALGVTFFTQSPFRGARPYVQDVRDPIARVDARLWQDPFMAVIGHVGVFNQVPSAHPSNRLCLAAACRRHRDVATGKPEHCRLEVQASEGTLAVQCAGTAGPDPFRLTTRMQQGKVTVLGVMVSGNRFAEDAEQRTRYRYAVLSGLRRLGFIPEDPEHIEYVEVATSAGGRTGVVSLSDIMPYEWLRHSDGKDSVLLLWINDDVFRENPLVKLDRLAEWSGLPRWEKRDLSFKIIGPAGSDTLRAMLQDARDAEAGAFSALDGAGIFSALATADDSQLLEGVGESQLPDGPAGGMVVSMFRKHRIALTRTIRTDRELAGMILQELQRRNFRFDRTDDRILLVSEWDTFYGRSLNQIYKRILIEQKVPEVESRVRRVSYLRGIDGNLPGEKAERKDNDADGGGDASARSTKLEEPLGKSQYDYLRRLSQETYRQSLAEEGTVKAIGVLGSDFYDKYLVLQAFHERFPQAVFFTTDLDARFLHPDVVKWTRNLVVASNFDLALRRDALRDIQGDVPPFRDNYQTSLFFATLWAFGEDGYANPVKDLLRQKVAGRIPELVRPQLFEIGRYSAVKLSPDYDDINPGRNRPAQRAHALKIALFIVVTVALLLFFTSLRCNRFIRHTFHRAKKHWFAALIMIVSLTGVAAGFFRFVLGNPHEEPFSLLEGVSTWPAEALRVTAAVVAICFIARAVRQLGENSGLIERKFGLGDLGSGSATHGNCRFAWENLKELVRDPRNYSFRWQSEMNLKNLWQEYVRRDSFAFRVLRLIPVVLSYAVLCFCIIFPFGMPVSPVRGNLSGIIDRLTIFVSVVSFMFLVFYVFDAIRNCRRFIDMALKIVLDWHEGLVDNISAKHKGEADPEKESWDLVQLIAMRTDGVGKLIFYPFIVWFLMFLSRVQLFDNWQTPFGLAIVITLGAALAWGSAFFLRQSAENARAATVRFLRERRAVATFQDQPDQERLRRIEFALQEITDLREGAFAPFSKHPLVQALFVPFGGVGGVYLLDFLSKMNI